MGEEVGKPGLRLREGPDRTARNPGLRGASGPACPITGRVLIFFVLCYRATLGRLMGGHCRFHPTCSQYMIDAIQKYGAVRGTWRGMKRIARCHPLGGKGYDPA